MFSPLLDKKAYEADEPIKKEKLLIYAKIGSGVNY